MAGPYFSKNLKVTFGGTDVSGNITRLQMDGPKAADPDVLDTTSGGDSSHTEIMGMKGAVRTRYRLTLYDDDAGDHNIHSETANNTGSLVAYPEGTGTGTETITHAGAVFLGVNRTFDVLGLAVVEAEFFALGAPT